MVCSQALNQVGDGLCRPMAQQVPDTVATSTCSGNMVCEAGTAQCKIANSASCTANSGCASGQCECADATCATKVCSAVDCDCRFNSNGDATCDGNLGDGIDDGDNTCAALSCNGQGACNLADAASCSDDALCESNQCECTNATCSARVCAAANCVCGYSPAGGCSSSLTDFTDDPQDCAGTQTCVGGACLTENGGSCASNGACVETCILGVCNNVSSTLGDCDDDADCTSGHTCSGNQCLLQNGQACTNNNQCLNTCLGGFCADRSAFDGPCDAADDTDCLSSAHGCAPGVNQCRRRNGDDCTPNDNAACMGTCISNTCADVSLAGEVCDDNLDCQGALNCDTVVTNRCL
ncbi:MAG: hypothetical protein R3C68_15390 [Myxococcota bacterium]